MIQQEAPHSEALKIGDVVEGTVEQIVPYGVFVRLNNGKRAMIHISELSRGYVKKVEDVMELNQKVKAKVIKIDERGRIDLSIKKLQEENARPARATSPAEDFEKKLASFLKASEEKMMDLSKKTKDGKGSRSRGKK
ncbi:S1 RNA-binding domain-containing protein [Thermovirga lienii]|uniref:S1 RNA-binding domain-containing protein n=1 Tax=Thermovirga lienii TaxID=336261 RepID=UPI00074732CA|nr:MAG: RNA binding S1 domain protein [Thermovirga lienii]